MVRGALIFHHLSIDVFERLKTVLETEDRHPIISLDFLKRTARARNGRLIITMRHPLIYALAQFTPQIAKQMEADGLLPAGILSWNTLLAPTQTSVRLKWGARERYIQAHGSLSLFRHDREFLIVEFTYAKRSKEIISKARDYIFGSDPPINIVVFVQIDNTDGSEVIEDGTRAETQVEDPWHEDHDTLLQTDRVTVTVFKCVPMTTESGELRSVMSTVIDKVEVWPTPATDKDFFTIKWSDMNWSPWEKFAAERELAPGPEPVWHVALSGLSNFGRRAARLDTPPSI